VEKGNAILILHLPPNQGWFNYGNEPPFFISNYPPGTYRCGRPYPVVIAFYDLAWMAPCIPRIIDGLAKRPFMDGSPQAAAIRTADKNLQPTIRPGERLLNKRQAD
jgi:hypothetical protein